MTQRELKYRPAPGCSQFTLLFPNALYIGEDHLLLRTRAVLAEYYRRVYFADIQAVVLEPTTARGTWTVIFGLAALAGIFAGVLSNPLALIAGGVFLASTIANIVMGPTCRCYIQTAVRYQPLPSITRLSRAREFLAFIQPAIAASQGETSAQQVRADSVRNLVDASRPAAIDTRSSTAPSRYAGGAHAALFGLMIAETILIATGAFTEVQGLICLCLPLNIAVAIVAWGKQAHTFIPNGVKRMPTAIALYSVAMIVPLCIMSNLFTVGTSNNKAFFPEYVPYYLFLAACSAALGIIGFLQLSVFRRACKARGQTPPPLRQ